MAILRNHTIKIPPLDNNSSKNALHQHPLVFEKGTFENIYDDESKNTSNIKTSHNAIHCFDSKLSDKKKDYITYHSDVLWLVNNIQFRHCIFIAVDNKSPYSFYSGSL